MAKKKVHISISIMKMMFEILKGIKEYAVKIEILYSYTVFGYKQIPSTRI